MMKDARTRRTLLKMVPYVTLAISLGIVAVATWIIVRTADAEDRANFSGEVEQLKNRITARFESQESLLRGVAGLLAIYPTLSKTDFQTYVSRLDLDRAYRGTLGVGFIQYVKASEVNAFEERLRQEHGPGYHIYPTLKELPRSDIYAVLYIEPDRNTGRRGFGFDFGQEANRRRAIEHARDTGSPTLGNQVHFIHRDGTLEKEPGFHLFLPVYRTGTIPSTIDQRRAGFEGVVFCPFRSEAILREITQSAPFEISAALFDGSAAEGAPFFGPSVPRSTAGMRTIEVNVNLGEHVWTIVAWRGVGIGSDIGRALPAVGIAVALLLFMLSLSQSRSSLKTQDALAELQRAERVQRLLAQVGAALSSSLDYNRTLCSVADLVVPELADNAVIDLVLDGDNVRRLVAVGSSSQVNEGLLDLERRWPTSIGGPSHLAQVLKTGESAFFPLGVEDSVISQLPEPEHREFILGLNLTSIIIVPIRNGASVRGALSLLSRNPHRRFTMADLELAKEIGLRAGLSVENSLNAEAIRKEADVRKRAEEEVRRLNQGLEQVVADRTRELAAANKELEAFCYSVSHDLRAPLRSVDGFTKAVLDDYGDRLDADGLDFLNRVRAAARRMDELITALLELSRITRAEMELSEVDISGLASSAAAEQAATYGATYDVQIAPGLKAEADPRMTGVVMDNLVGNAMKFSSKSENPRIEVGSIEEKGKTAFFVRDNGTGFNPAYAAKLFVPFERLHSTREYPGSGVGLATVQRIVQKHGGQVWAESEEGKGATFYFTLG